MTSRTSRARWFDETSRRSCRTKSAQVELADDGKRQGRGLPPPVDRLRKRDPQATGRRVERAEKVHASGPEPEKADRECPKERVGDPHGDPWAEMARRRQRVRGEQHH